MDRHRSPAPASRRQAGPAGAGGPGLFRAFGGARGVAAALAVALLAGLAVLWLTRPSEAMSGVPSGDSLPTVTSAATPAPSASSASRDVLPRPAARPATPPPADGLAAPTGLAIGRLGIDMDVRPVGVARDGEMALPRTPADVGWYEFGPRPGDPRGATVLAAHLDMPGYGTGPIAAIDHLRRGDVITVRTGSTRTRYAVTDVRGIRKTRLDLDALFTREGPAVLHVVTCGGAFDPEARRYDRNIVVTATPLS
jgi:hypothetical protein